VSHLCVFTAFTVNKQTNKHTLIPPLCRDVFACVSSNRGEAGLGNSRTEIPCSLQLNVSYCNDSISAACSLEEATLLFHIRNVIKNDIGMHNYFLPILLFHSNPLFYSYFLLPFFFFPFLQILKFFYLTSPRQNSVLHWMYK